MDPMACKICFGSRIEKVYSGPIRLGIMTGESWESVDVYYCHDCGVFWHNYSLPENHYEGEEYRKWVDGASSMEDYYRMHDEAVLRKLSYTGTSLYRNKMVIDVGCAGGSFLDFLKGVSKEVIGIEPSLIYREGLRKKGIPAFAYASEAREYFGQADVVTSWDVIEHVNDPIEFLRDMCLLLKPGGQLVVGTPTEYPVLRKLLGETFDRFIFQANHPWIFSEKSLKLMADKVGGLEDIQIQQKFRYGIGNTLAWLQKGKPLGDMKFDFVSGTLNAVWQEEMLKNGLGEYFVMTALKTR